MSSSTSKVSVYLKNDPPVMNFSLVNPDRANLWDIEFLATGNAATLSHQTRLCYHILLEQWGV